MKNNLTYRVFNFVIHSEFSLKKLHDRVLLTKEYNNLYLKHLTKEIELNEIIFEGRNIRIYDNGFVFQPGSLYFVYQHECKTITVRSTDHRLFDAYLFGPVIALVGAFNNYIPLHSSGLLLKDNCLLILGNSGSGKSTLLYEMLKKYEGYYFSDDLVFIGKQNGKVVAYPSYPEIKLWHDAAERLGAIKLSSIYYKLQKYHVDDNSRFIDSENIPNILIFLQTSTQSKFQIEELKGSQKWLYLQSMMYRKKWIENAFQKIMFELLSLLSNQCKAYKFVRPLNTDKTEWDEVLKNFIYMIVK